MKKILLLAIIGLLFSCASTPDTTEGKIQGSWKYIPVKDDIMTGGKLDFNADGSYYYHGYTPTAKKLQIGKWSITDTGELELFMEKEITNDSKEQKINRNVFVEISVLSKSQLILKFGKNKEFKREFRRQ